MHETLTLPAEPSAATTPHHRQTPPHQRAVRTPRSLKRRLLGLVIYGCYLLVIVELVCRGYWWKRWGVPFLHMDQIWAGRFYPELVESGLATAAIPRGDATFDILLLGGSVLHAKHGNIAALLEQKLNSAQSRPVKVWNCSARALTSRDCLLKYERFADKHFDLVVFYEAINEARMNNCPREMFRADLTHCSWYKRLDSFQKHREINWLVSPFTIQDTLIGALDSPNLMWYLPREHPPEGAWSEAGHDIKTDVSFRNSLTGLINLAHERGEPLLLLGYAVHIPPDYTRAKFLRHELSYGAHFGPAECWGQPAAVRAAVAAENAVTRDLAAKHPRVHYVDLDAVIPKDAAHFDDPCHLTAAGCAAWVEGVLPTIREVIATSLRGSAARENAGLFAPSAGLARSWTPVLHFGPLGRGASNTSGISPRSRGGMEVACGARALAHSQQALGRARPARRDRDDRVGHGPAWPLCLPGHGQESQLARQ